MGQSDREPRLMRWIVIVLFIFTGTSYGQHLPLPANVETPAAIPETNCSIGTLLSLNLVNGSSAYKLLRTEIAAWGWAQASSKELLQVLRTTSDRSKLIAAMLHTDEARDGFLCASHALG